MKASRYKTNDIVFAIDDYEKRKWYVIVDVSKNRTKNLEILEYCYQLANPESKENETLVRNESKISPLNLRDYLILKLYYLIDNLISNLYKWLLKESKNRFLIGLKLVTGFILSIPYSTVEEAEEEWKQSEKPLPAFPVYACSYLNRIVLDKELDNKADKAGRMARVRKFRRQEKTEANSEAILKKINPEIIRVICKPEYIDLRAQVKAKEIAKILKETHHVEGINHHKVERYRNMINKIGRKNALKIIEP